MIISCPECSARYKVKDHLIKNNGKKVKCKRCEAIFIAYPDKKSVTLNLNSVSNSKNERKNSFVQIDRSTLEKFLKQGDKNIPTPVEENHIESFLKKSLLDTDNHHAENSLDETTVIVDREEFEKYLSSDPTDFPTEKVDCQKILDFLKTEK